MLKKIGIISIVAFVIGMNLPVAGANSERRLKNSTVTILSKIGHHEFHVEIAKTIPQQRLGLMYRRSLAHDAGMLFIYSVPQILKMWMKNTLLPLDILFIDTKGFIVSIKERAMPGSLQTISSGKSAIAVLELNGGTVSRLKILPGDRVRY